MCGQRERVLVAMSGGVDSSVAAALLLEAGYEVVGVTLHLWDADGPRRVGRCCTPEDRDDARAVAARLGIPHYIFDRRSDFRAHVVAPFMAEYARGRTPSPCVHCNRAVKLGPLFEVAEQLGCSRIASGHYARVRQGADGRPRLYAARDPEKDQSYFLHAVPAEVLARVLFPLGEYTKEETRTEAARLGLPTAEKPDSQELCFVPDGRIPAFLSAEGRPPTPGPVVDTAGNVLGAHDGIEGFTVGQRRGLGLGGGGAPRYVLRIVPETGAVVVGPQGELESHTLHAEAAHFIGAPPEESFEARIRIRHGAHPVPARVTVKGAAFDAVFHEPVRAITPGQAAVVYDGDEVLGGGFVA